jgi:hypothetical protein
MLRVMLSQVSNKNHNWYNNSHYHTQFIYSCATPQDPMTTPLMPNMAGSITQPSQPSIAGIGQGSLPTLPSQPYFQDRMGNVIPVTQVRTWKCRKCKTLNLISIFKCQCGMNQKENKDNWLCKDCKTLNLTSIHYCRVCNRLKKRKLQDYEHPILDRDKLLIMMKQTYTLRIRALYCFLYLTGCRISEVLGHIKTTNFEMADLEGHDFLYINRIPVLKKRKAMVRQVAVNIDRERDFVEPLMEYVLFVSEKRDENVPLWNLSSTHAYRFMREITCKEYPEGLFNHFFRHQRLSHLVLYYGFNQNELKEFSKHTNITNLDFYVHLSNKDIARKMI